MWQVIRKNKHILLGPLWALLFLSVWWCLGELHRAPSTSESDFLQMGILAVAVALWFYSDYATVRDYHRVKEEYLSLQGMLSDQAETIASLNNHIAALRTRLASIHRIRRIQAESGFNGLVKAEEALREKYLFEFDTPPHHD